VKNQNRSCNRQAADQWPAAIFSSPATVRRPPFTFSRGFTLIEILVVIVIIGVIVSMATLSVNLLGRDSQVEEQARRFWAVLRQTREEAELQGLNIGVYFAAEEYEFLRLDALTNMWVSITDDKLYATRQLPEGLRYRLWLDSREIVLKPTLPDRGDDDKDDDEGLSDEEKEEAQLPKALRAITRDQTPRIQENPPQVVVLSSGDIMPFELQIERERGPALWRLVALADNDLRIEQRRTSSEAWEVFAQTNPPLDEREVKPNARK
jgi:general secretion pathway protein H